MGKYIGHLRGKNIFHSIMAKGSGKEELHSLARKILITTRNMNIQLEVVWKRRTEEEMVRADLGSRGL